jgi:hypothetical protein
LSPVVLRMVGSAATLASFAESSALLKELPGVEVNAKQVERAAEALGQEIAQDERQHVEPRVDTVLPSTLYLGIERTGISMRSSELAGRSGKQPDGTAKTREVKLVTGWSAEPQDAQGIPVRDPGSVTYSAAIESAATHDSQVAYSEFTQRVQRQATRCRFQQASRTMVLGDGAPYIWNIADELECFSTAVACVRDELSKQSHQCSILVWKELAGGPTNPVIGQF